MLAHLRDLHAFYGEEAGVRVARKHIDWYAKSQRLRRLYDKP